MRLRDIFRQGRVSRSGSVTLWTHQAATARRHAAIIIRSTPQRLNSVQRHRVRRQIKEILRRSQQQPPPSTDWVVIIRCQSTQLPAVAQLERDLLAVCRASLA